MVEPSGRAYEYLVEFQVHEQQLRQAGYNDAALTRMFYDGLNIRLVIALGLLPEGPPRTLEQLQYHVLLLDKNYWETRSRLTEPCRYHGFSISSRSRTPSTPSTNGSLTGDLSETPYSGSQHSDPESQDPNSGSEAANSDHEDPASGDEDPASGDEDPASEDDATSSA